MLVRKAVILVKHYSNKKNNMKKVKKIIAASLFALFTLAASAQQFSKADQAIVANYSITIEKVNQYMQFQKSVDAEQVAESKHASLNPPRTLDEAINQTASSPSFVKLIKSCGSTPRDMELTHRTLRNLFDANDPNPKKRVAFKMGCDRGFTQMPSAEQMAFAKAHSAEMIKWQNQLNVYWKAELAH